MKLKVNKIIFPVFFITLLGFLYVFNSSENENYSVKINKMRSTDSPKAEQQSVKGREEYLFTMLRDPKTNRIPDDVVYREMKFTENIKNKGLRKTNADLITWKEAGPKDVGGRTRALGVDIRDAKIVLAGGVSGGIWKTTDKGSTWKLKFTTTQVLSVSSLVQDIRAGHEDTWYAATGEFIGNSATKTGAAFRGAGIYKSVDNGDTWQLLPKDDDVTLWDSPLDYISKIAINPVTGSLFIASNGYGILKSTDGGINGDIVLGDNNSYCELDIAANGTMVATLSEATNSSSAPSKVGVWMSQDDGVNWTDVTPVDYPVGLGYNRAVAAIAPSNTDVCYVLVEIDDDNDDNRIFKINLASNSSVDLSANLPDFSGSGKYKSQGSYNMLIAVKPDDENFVLIGGTNIYRSFDGFATPLTQLDKDWIGGYDPEGGSWVNSHPDIHSFAFEPGFPARVWIGHDGGLSYASKITGLKGIDFSTAFSWTNKNKGYNVTQVYHVAIPRAAGDNRIMAGTQDNGTPYFKFDGSTILESRDVSSGDGSYCYFGEDKAYVSTQNGSMIQLGYVTAGDVPSIFSSTGGVTYAFIHPSDATNQYFINPFAVDPTGETVLYYPAGTSIWRNKQIKNFQPSSGGWDGQSFGWVKQAALEIEAGYRYSAINVSNENSSHVLYFAAYNASASPKIFRLDNADVVDAAAVDISISALPAGSFINEIEINPLNSNEIIVVATNYNIIGLYHSIDGGSTYSAIEANLAGDEGRGPSLRSAKILPTPSGTIYLVGTSVGLFSTLYLDGANTVWQQEGADIIGNVVVASLDARTSDNYVAVGTHGRGVFTGTAKTIVGIKQLDELPTSYTLSQNYPNPFNPTTNIRYSVPVASNVSLKIFNTNGEEVSEIVNQYMGAGTFEASWNGTNSRGAKVASGAYIYTLRAGDFVQTKKMIMLK
ncbi:MAG: T9SS type A sorting domain-containing protein [Bacteroidetes bacterium]|nr:T9SS type A sorting domain-containing protein [Bacteroidota bacterium]